MAHRTSWRGFLKLSLVSVPVKAFTANNSSEEVRLNQLHSDCHSRVKYKKVCPEHGELRSDGFVSPDEIDPAYFAGKTYFLLPDGVAGDRPHAPLVQGTEDSGLAAVPQMVLSGREQLVMLRPEEGMLTMTVLAHAKRVKAAQPFRDELTEEKASKEELALANTLLQASTLQEFDFQAYEDTDVENLTKLIQLKVDGQEVVQAPDPEEPKIINQMQALKKSVAEAGAHKMAPSAMGAKKTACGRKKRTG